MQPPDLTQAQQHVLLEVPGHFSVQRIDRLWIFPPRVGKSVETGLLVLCLREEASDASERREVHTLRYELQLGATRARPVVAAQEEGRTSLERIERVIAGVLARAGEDSGEPYPAAIEASPERWTALLDELGVRLDGSSR